MSTDDPKRDDPQMDEAHADDAHRDAAAEPTSELEPERASADPSESDPSESESESALSSEPTADDATESEPVPASVIAENARLGMPMIVRGALGVIFGFITVFWPRDAANPTQLSLGVDVVDWLCMAYLVLFGLTLVLESSRAPERLRTPILGQAVIVVPAVVFLFLADEPSELRAAISIWAILHGLIEYWNHRQLKGYPMASDFLIVAGVHALLGIILMFGDGFGALSVLGFTGAATLIAGVLFIIGGYSRISKARASK